MEKPSDIYSKKGLLKIINALPMAICVIDKNRVITLSNNATALYINKNKEQLIGLKGGEAFGCIHHEEDPQGCGFGQDCLRCKLRQILMETLDNQTPRTLAETTMVFKNLGKRHLRISTLPIILNNEEMVLCSLEDITQVKHYEQALVEKEKLAAAVETAGAICHEINQPLMIILGMAELLMEDSEDSDPKIEMLTEIMNQAQRLGEITRRLMGLTSYKTKTYIKSNILDIEGSSTPSRDP